MANVAQRGYNQTKLMRKGRRIIIGIVILAIVPVALLFLLSLFARRPSNLGEKDGHLAPCPSTPNCVSTEAVDAEHQIAPLHFEGSADAAMARLQSIIGRMPRMRLVVLEGNYLYVEFTSQIFRFTDDVEFLIDPATNTIHFRSASRVGSSDLGVNRLRMEEIRAQFDKRP